MLSINRRSTSRAVNQARLELMAAFCDPKMLPGKAAAYAAAIRRHRETIFATLFGGESRGMCQAASTIIATTRSGPDASNDLYNEVRLGAVFNS